MMHAAAACDHTASVAFGGPDLPNASRVVQLSSQSNTGTRELTGGSLQRLRSGFSMATFH
eukprot:CAMPEP_0181173746 /NCGR_PEP_ID=MMETSP1096-20121128/3165_1 /TAXON_ID=156174 ORGANISM="Chrysochromulina ericina, Strain CCMP281" /NCGR_SAMPLE_ID=MMETSP1096 /ASSEMBLY_ACC=CAM_ASM_000453 /LENGTH=59 /DNA_ID=CAMNT_0023261597 /DNA_START=437 /DNA_END=616 /DNA_ORIENTATION=+